MSHETPVTPINLKIQQETSKWFMRQNDKENENLFNSTEMKKLEPLSSSMVTNTQIGITSNMKKMGMIKRRIIEAMDPPLLLSKVNQYYSLNTKIKIIDLITNLLDVITVITFYNDHFDYIDHGLEISDKSNRIRFIFIGTSAFICILLIYRYYLNNIRDAIAKDLEIKNKVKDENNYSIIKRRYLYLELIIHIVQPYPYLKLTFTITIVGFPIIYSLNMILYFLCTLRLYNIIKVLRVWNLYSTSRAKKIVKFFDRESNTDLFLCKANLDSRGFLTLITLGVICVSYFCLLLKVLEYYKYDKSNPLNYIINNIWYLVVTMSTIGYGDITPQTVLGRIIGVIVCLIGDIILSLLVVNLTLFTYLDDDELVAYYTIKSLSSSEIKRKKIDNYIHKLLLERIKLKFKRVDLESAINKYHLCLNKIDCNIKMHKQRHQKNMHIEFIDTMKDIIEGHCQPLYEGFKGLWEFEDNLEEYFTINDELCGICKESKNLILSCLNLGKCITTVGSIKKIKNIEEIQHKKLISTAELRSAKKKYMKSNSNNQDGNGGSPEWKKSSAKTLKYRKKDKRKIKNLDIKSEKIETLIEEEQEIKNKNKKNIPFSKEGKSSDNDLLGFSKKYVISQKKGIQNQKDNYLITSNSSNDTMNKDKSRYHYNYYQTLNKREDSGAKVQSLINEENSEREDSNKDEENNNELIDNSS